MSIDLLVPFLVLIFLAIYLIYSRTKFENNILSLYEEKFENWKKNSFKEPEIKEEKKIIGIVFKNNDKIIIELVSQKEEILIKRGRFGITIRKD